MKMSVVIETTLGDLTVDLFVDQRPLACLNFLKLCKLKYYNFNLFHTIQHGFIAQTGDPTGKGDGGHSIWGVLEGPTKRYFEGEQIPKIKHTNPGLLSMVGTSDGMVGSQFFFTLASDLISLDGQHCIIGEVTEGIEILRLLNETICDSTHRPYQDVRITHTVILEDPYNDPKGFHAPSRSPSPSAERLAGGRIAPDEEIDETKGKTEEEIAEIIEAKEAKARATILEIVGDLPDADMAPPENVLFVCKLNPVTNDDDLEIIFGRFGKINCCEVIRDRKTGDSLQYAFIEFDDKKSCEDAYFKMDNVLIDDRRIHVDFSQSVSKIKWRGKGRGVIHMDNNGKPINENVKPYESHVQSNRNGKSAPGDGKDRNNYSSSKKDSSDSRSDRVHGNRDRSENNYHREKDSYSSQRRSREKYRHNSAERRKDSSPKSSRHHGERRENRHQRDNHDNKNYPSRSRDRTTNRDFSDSRRYVSESSSRDTHSRRYSPNRRYNEVHKYNNFKSGSSSSRREHSRSPKREIKPSSSNTSTMKVREASPSRDKDDLKKSQKHPEKDVKSKKRKSDSSHVDDVSNAAEESPPMKKKSEKEAVKSKKKKPESSSESSSSGNESTNKKQHKKKKSKTSNKTKRKRAKSTSSDTSSSYSDSSDSSEDSSSSSSDCQPDKKSKKKKLVKKKKYSSSSSSSANSSSSSGKFTSDSSDSGHEASRKKFKNKKSMREKIIKKKKHKK